MQSFFSDIRTGILDNDAGSIGAFFTSNEKHGHDLVRTNFKGINSTISQH